MNFSEQLNNYIDLIKCTAKELSKESGLSGSVISRYRNSRRIPLSNSAQLKDLSKGLSILANKNKINNMSYESIIHNFEKILNDEKIDTELLRYNFNILIEALNISSVELAKSLNFDASYLSRIRTGKRKPADPKFFTESICKFVVNKYTSDSNIKTISNLINCDIKDKSEIFDGLSNWIYSNSKKSPDYINDFLKKVDDFDLNEYIRLIHFDKLKVPTLPFQLGKSKNYYGNEQMKQGELDFFKSTVLSKSTDDVFMCSDMPMEEMAKDVEFGKKWMFGIAMLLKKKLHLNVIHNVDRPFNEMMLGLESWIPIYMTGQISPYYFKKIQNDIYCHLNYVSGNCALQGGCINGHHNEGKYYLTNNKEDIKYYKKKAKYLIKKASPLIEIYRKDSKNLYNTFLKNSFIIKGNRHNILSSPPLYTISNELLLKILEGNKVKKEDIESICNYVESQKNSIKKTLSHSKIYDEIIELTEEEFENYHVSLNFSGYFHDKKINYTYSEYLEHFSLTKKYLHKNYSLKINNDIAFRNIQIFILENNYVIISKNTNPTINFVIRHSKLCAAIENFVAPIKE